MLLNLKQMIGRLIRSEEDRGVVVIVEGRPGRTYFQKLAGALPADCAPRVIHSDELDAVLDEIGLRSG
jgi:Rad3-related DNA helicase